MTDTQRLLLTYLTAVNLFAFLLIRHDKLQAVRKKHRISERRLLFISLIGGAPGSYLAMKLFRHKTRKLKFQILIPLSALILLVTLFQMIIR